MFQQVSVTVRVDPRPFELRNQHYFEQTQLRDHDFDLDQQKTPFGLIWRKEERLQTP